MGIKKDVAERVTADALRSVLQAGAEGGLQPIDLVRLLLAAVRRLADEGDPSLRTRVAALAADLTNATP